MQTLQKKLEETQSEKHNAETQFRNLLGKVNTIKAQLGERLRADAVRFCPDQYYILVANELLGRIKFG